MAQKSNLITLRKKANLDLVAQNPKLLISFLKVIENINRLFFFKGVWLAKNSISLDTSLVFVYFSLYFQSSTTRKYKKRLDKKKANKSNNNKKYIYNYNNYNNKTQI